MVTAPTVSEDLLEQLRAEAEAARALQHPTIPALYDFGLEDGQLIYVTEICEGTTALAWVAARGPLPAEAVLQIGLQIVHAIRVTACTISLIMRCIPATSFFCRHGTEVASGRGLRFFTGLV